MLRVAAARLVMAVAMAAVMLVGTHGKLLEGGGWADGCARWRRALNHTCTVQGVNWAYLGKFCFDTMSDTGRVGFMNITVATPLSDVVVYVYSDEPDSWPAIANADVPCAVKSESEHAAEVLPVTPGRWVSTVQVVPQGDPGYAYVGIGSKGCAYQLSDTSFSILMLNPGPTQFSVDDYGFVDMYTLFCVIYVVGFLCHIYGHYRMRFWYPLAVRVFGFSLLSTTLAMLCLAIHYGSYASNGVGTPSLEALGRLFAVLGRLSQFALCGLLASGLGIVTMRTSVRDNWAAVSLLTLIVAMYFATLIWYEVGRDPWSNEYVFDSGYGAILVVMEILFMSLWVFRVRALMALIPAAATRKWVFRVGIVGCVAFAVMPLTVVLGGFVVDYARKRAVYAFQSVASFAVYTAFAYYLFPTTANRVFLRKGPRGAVGTSQLLHEDDDVEGQSSDGSDLSDSDGPDVGAGAGAGAGYDAGVAAPMARDPRVTSRLPVMPESEELAHL